MFALRAGKAGRSVPAAGSAASPEGFVLPRWLRRPARMLSRLGEGEFAPPRFAATMLVSGFLGLTAAYGAALGGHVPEVVQAVSGRGGFAVDAVKVVGNAETSEIDILQELGLDGWTSLVGFDAEDARRRIADLPWVKQVSVRKTYPNTLEVKLEERKPFAIWQHGRQLSLVEASGAVIAPFRSQRHAMLPLVIGLGAASEAEGFIARVAAYPELAARVKAYIRIAERRWDLRLENGITVRLPMEGEDRALADLVAMDRDSGLLSRDILAVDMRIDDRLVVQLTPEAAMRRDAALKERGKNAGRRSEKRV